MFRSDLLNPLKMTEIKIVQPEGPHYISKYQGETP